MIFGSAHGAELRASLREIATGAGMALCGAGCMGFVNLVDDLRATGYIERELLPRGPIALVTHSGSIFSALLRTRRALGYTIAVSSGQELVTTTADYLDFVLEHTDTTVLALVLEAARDGTRFVDGLRRAASAGVPVVLLRSAARRSDRGWSPHTPVPSPARTRPGRRSLRGRARLSYATWPSSPTPSNCWRSDVARAAGSIASVHDSGAERTLLCRPAPTTSGCRSPHSAGDAATPRCADRRRPGRREPARPVGQRREHT